MNSIFLHHNSKLPFTIFQDLQAEVDAHQGTYESLNSAGNQLANKMVGTDVERLHRRLEEMNQRWLSLMTKSMEIRCVFLYVCLYINLIQKVLCV